MATTLRVIVDQLVAPVPGSLGRYTFDLTRQLIASAPSGCSVQGIVSSSPPSDYERVEAMLPGLAGLYRTSLARRELAAAWQFGMTTSPGGGMIHAPGLLAPLRRHERENGDQVVVTVHDLLAWTRPDALTASSVAQQKAMLKRARKHADAIVTPTHALADQLGMIAELGDRVRVIGTAPRSGLVVPADREERRARLGLPDEYLITVGTLVPWHGVIDVLAALGRPGVPDIPLVVLGPASWGEQQLAEVADESGVRANRVRSLELDDPADVATAIAGASALIAPAHDAGAGTVLIEAFSLGVPVIHSDTAAYVEVAAESGLAVAIGTGGYVDRLAAAVSQVLEHPALASRLAIAGADRARAFSWRDSAERVWQLHADL
ncbi:glycosyltransferase family 4 protein [Agromyces intestinalis]|uniref:Glycosyltransferase family 4 protein n=1 Tax=Agromyces intestinalis TaxID=2592652 RepID=A0A5C1YD58_9MICO|nr:glycosyltransferase [Agromyces intestinalis]QEO13568.1 glycosyltransferase family 4 protein [Agromyces intestinalis]